MTFVFNSKIPRDIGGHLPPVNGAPIRVSVRPSLTAYRGRLLSKDEKGKPVHAGSFLRKREIVLESGLLRTPHRLTRIFIHEVAHFLWWKSGNAVRRSYEQCIASELRRGAPGELGWSAECLKLALTHHDPRSRSTAWRAYICESFCDTCAWAFGTRRRYSEVTLPAFYRAERAAWLRTTLPSEWRL